MIYKFPIPTPASLLNAVSLFCIEVLLPYCLLKRHSSHVSVLVQIFIMWDVYSFFLTFGLNKYFRVNKTLSFSVLFFL